MRRIPSFFLLAVLFLVHACSDGTGEEERGKEIAKDMRTSQKKELDSLERPKAFLLPTPTQIPALLHNTTVEYHPSLLLQVDSLPALPYKKDKALQLGGLMIDAAYSGINEDPSRVKGYAKRIRKLADNLYLGALIKQERIESLKELADQKGPLTEELLSFYRDAHKEFKKERKKELGFHMVKGAFVEGLYLSVLISERAKNDPWGRIVDQQGRYFQNLRKLRGLLFQNKKNTDAVWKELKALMKEVGKGDGKVKGLSSEEVEKLREKTFF